MTDNVFTPETFLNTFATKGLDQKDPNIEQARGLVKALGLDTDSNPDFVAGAQGFIRVANAAAPDIAPGVPSDKFSSPRDRGTIIAGMVDGLNNAVETANLWSKFEQIEQSTNTKIPPEIRDAIYDYYTKTPCHEPAPQLSGDAPVPKAF